MFLLKLFVLIHFCHWKEKREHHSSFILNEYIHLHCDVCYREWKIIDARKRTHIAIQFECLLSLVLSTVFQQMTINERSPFKTIISSSWCRILFERMDSWNPLSYFIRNKEQHISRQMNKMKKKENIIEDRKDDNNINSTITMNLDGWKTFHKIVLFHK